MKRLLLTLGLSLSALVTFAQGFGYTEYPTITWGIAGGSSFAGFYLSGPQKQFYNTSLSLPLSIGISADYRFNDYFSIKPAIFYAGKGTRIDAQFGDFGNYVAVSDDYRLHYLEIPVNFIGHLPVGDGANIFLGAGPYYSKALNGKRIINYNADDKVSQSVKFGTNGDFKSSDYGLSTVIGFQGAKGWSISGNFELGLTNILQNGGLGIYATKAKTGVFYLTIGQSF